MAATNPTATTPILPKAEEASKFIAPPVAPVAAGLTLLTLELTLVLDFVAAVEATAPVLVAIVL